MANVKRRISEWLNLEQRSLNEISIDDIEFGVVEEEDINKEVARMLSLCKNSPHSADQTMQQMDGIACKTFWVENTKDLVLYVWNGNQSKAIIVPRNGWAIRDDITVH
jgi:hypothetical protein